MKNLNEIFNNIRSLKWYYQLAIFLTSIVLITLLIKFLLWFVPIILGIVFLLLLVVVGGGYEKIFSEMWESYKKRKQVPPNPLFTSIYHWLKSNVRELPLNTKSYMQGIEWNSGNAPDTFYVHLKKILSDKELEDFETNIRQAIKSMSEVYDGIITLVKKEPLIAIEIRVVSSNELLFEKQEIKEDF